MGKLKSLRKSIVTGKTDIDSLKDIQYDIELEVNRFLKTKVLSNEEFDELTELIMILLDYYIYSENGDVLISDHQYDLLMSHYIENGGKLLSYADILATQTQWNFVEHKYPGMVGTVRKIYSFEELCIYLSKYNSIKGYRKFRLAPKFDGISSAIEIDRNGKIISGVTRNDGVQGQDISQIVRNAKNSEEISVYYASKLNPGETVCIKTELVVTTDDYNELVHYKNYKNRRSATSGIINTPKNVDLARFVTIIPLAAHFTKSDIVEYVPLDSKEVKVVKPYDLMEEIEHMLSRIRDSSYQIRTDGVVIYPLGEDIHPNYDDIMDDAIAYKVNTEEGYTTVDFGYVSIGRLGNAIPMLRVKPVEVNETIVTDVSLGSFDKFASMDIHENEQIIVYSAGNVIPQVKLPEERRYNVDDPLVHIVKKCPHCNSKLVQHGGIYKCENMECPRVKSGRITNFLIKLDAENVSDKTVEDLMTNNLISDIPDLFNLEVDDIRCLPGYGTDSAKIIINEIDKIRDTQTPVSALIGALGINGISTKKCQNLFKVLTLKQMLDMDFKKLRYELFYADNTGEKTADTFARFICDNRKLIKQLTSIMHITNDVIYSKNVVFTGIGKDKELEKRFNEAGYSVSNNVNGDTVAVIDKSLIHDSTKCEKARSKGIDILHISEVDLILKKGKK